MYETKALSNSNILRKQWIIHLKHILNEPSLISIIGASLSIYIFKSHKTKNCMLISVILIKLIFFSFDVEVYISLHVVKMVLKVISSFYKDNFLHLIILLIFNSHKTVFKASHFVSNCYV